jgi:predicted SAM-dependent methyltransferase
MKNSDFFPRGMNADGNRALFMKKLNLGCGGYKKNEFVNVDVRPECHPDVVHDLNTFPYPFEDNRFEVVEVDHLLEHLENPLQAMTEIHRILEDHGRLTVRVPFGP